MSLTRRQQRAHALFYHNQQCIQQKNSKTIFVFFSFSRKENQIPIHENVISADNLSLEKRP